MKDNKVADKWRNEGNSFYKKGKFRDAVVAYNKSLCYSEPGSKQLALAYGNRSAVYLEVRLHAECLENIQLARENNHPDLSRLEEREEKCLEAREKKLKDPENYPEEFIKLSYEPNKKIPFIVDCLEMRENEQFGRHIITTRDLNPGDIIAIEEPALKMIGLFEPRYERCVFCLDFKKHNLIPCKNCYFAMFCSERCTAESMKKFHKAECDIFQQSSVPNDLYMISKCATIIRFMVESMELVTSREKFKNLIQGDSVSVFDFDFSDNNDTHLEWNRFRIVNGLLPSFDPKLKEYYKDLIKTTIDNLQLTEDEGGAISKFTLRLMQNLDRNSWVFLDKDKTVSRTKASYLFGSLVNHSCFPNTGVTSLGAKQVQFVTKPIKKNEQIFINYRNFEPNRSERKRELMKHYDFICSCPGCINDYPDGNLMPWKDPGFDYLSFISSSIVVGAWKSNSIALSNYIKKNFKFYPSYEINFCEQQLGAIIQNACWILEWPDQ